MSTAVSAPGKVLLAGGYLVLDRAHTGLVFGLSARIHVQVHDIETSSGVELSEIVVQSPQFKEAIWNYGYRLNEGGGGVEITQLHGSSTISRNPFVETALLYALTYISTLLPTKTIKPSKVIILADNDYYSNSPADITKHFSPFGVRLSEAHKTGLGSSAALVTAFTGAILSHYLPPTAFSLKDPNPQSESRMKLHNLAQIAHCAAQGKVGSGFDVAAAVYGTCIYRRFSPSVLSKLGEPGSQGFADRVQDLVDGDNIIVKSIARPQKWRWDYEIVKENVKLPEGMALVMCDVDCGSQTVSMVKKVLEWRQNDFDAATKLWKELQGRNDDLARVLSEFKGGNGDVAKKRFDWIFTEMRARIREMGEKSGVGIEPKEQTELLDALKMEVDGVMGGVVPGAGGYDAVVLLVRDDEATKKDIQGFLEKWSKEKKGNVKLLGAKGELEGARMEDIEGYGG